MKKSGVIGAEASWQAVCLPSLGEGVQEAQLRSWCKDLGQWVECEEPLLEISTDKVDAEVPAPTAGYLVRICKDAGQKVKVGELLAYLSSAAAKKEEEQGGGAEERASAEAEAASSDEDEGESFKQADGSAQPHEQRPYLSPYVRLLAQQHNIDLRQLSVLNGRGQDGRVTAEDVEIWLQGRSSSAPIARSNPSAVSEQEGSKREPLSPLRRTIARGVVHSVATAPHASVSCEVSLQRVVAIRSQGGGEGSQQKPSVTAFFLYALSRALKKHPLLRASVMGDEVIWHQNVHLGCAVALEGQKLGSGGVVVPVIRHADTLSLEGLSCALKDVVRRVRCGTLKIEETRGGTFTFTNPGMFGPERSQALIQQPQVAILSAGAMKSRFVPVFKSQETTAKAAVDELMPCSALMGWRRCAYADLTLTFDHRLIDGKEGSLFLRDIKQLIEQGG